MYALVDLFWRKAATYVQGNARAIFGLLACLDSCDIETAAGMSISSFRDVCYQGYGMENSPVFTTVVSENKKAVPNIETITLF